MYLLTLCQIDLLPGMAVCVAQQLSLGLMPDFIGRPAEGSETNPNLRMRITQAARGAQISDRGTSSALHVFSVVSVLPRRFDISFASDTTDSYRRI